MNIAYLQKDKDYWYVFLPQSAINLQTVKLEKVYLETLKDDDIFKTKIELQKARVFIGLPTRKKKSFNSLTRPKSIS